MWLSLEQVVIEGWERLRDIVMVEVPEIGCPGFSTHRATLSAQPHLVFSNLCQPSIDGRLRRQLRQLHLVDDLFPVDPGVLRRMPAHNPFSRDNTPYI